MTKALGLLLAVLAIWTTVEIYTRGTHGAFGGALVPLLGERATPEASRLSAPRRAEAAVDRAHEVQQEKYDKLLED